MVHCITLPVTELAQNCRIVVGAQHQCFVVDPGGDVEMIVASIQQASLQPVAILLTHAHFDHCGGVAALLRHYPLLPLYAHPQEKSFRGRVQEIARMYGLGAQFENCPEPTHTLIGNEQLSIAGVSIKVLFVPGHAPGHLCFYLPEISTLIAGDTVFAGAIGRTDLPQGDHALLLRSIKERIFPLPDDTVVMPGHGRDTVLVEEKRHNPFLVHL